MRVIKNIILVLSLTLIACSHRGNLTQKIDQDQKAAHDYALYGLNPGYQR